MYKLCFLRGIALILLALLPADVHATLNVRVSQNTTHTTIFVQKPYHVQGILACGAPAAGSPALRQAAGPPEQRVGARGRERRPKHKLARVRAFCTRAESVALLAVSEDADEQCLESGEEQDCPRKQSRQVLKVLPHALWSTRPRCNHAELQLKFQLLQHAHSLQHVAKCLLVSLS